MGIYDYKVVDRMGAERSLADYQGKVLLIVNTATACGFTPQYEELEQIYDALSGRGLEILDFPCNQFGEQAPGSDEEIHKFCTMKFNTKFPRFKKVEVNGPGEIPLYGYLKSQQGFRGFTGEKAAFMDDYVGKLHPDYKSTPDIKWNFTKFLVSRDGEVVARFEPTEDMGAVRRAIEAQL
ncbi:MAG: glutathione peroxidase [Succinivibrionaceae bacterium]|nr:glutathione peroxidase [Succinivibrionaceae bacterium]